MKKTLIKNSLKIAITLALSTSVVKAADFYFGEDNDILLSINSQLSVGTSIRMTDRNPRFYSAANSVDGIFGTAGQWVFN